QSASARPPPEYSRYRPIIAPSPTTTATNPSASPKPVWTDFSTLSGGIPAATPSVMAVIIRPTNACNFSTRIRNRRKAIDAAVRRIRVPPLGGMKGHSTTRPDQHGPAPPVTATKHVRRRTMLVRTRRLRANTERLDPISKLRSLLEFELAGSLPHPLFELADKTIQLFGGEVLDLFVRFERHRHVIALRDPDEAHVDRLHDRLRHNVVPLVVIRLD